MDKARLMKRSLDFSLRETNESFILSLNYKRKSEVENFYMESSLGCDRLQEVQPILIDLAMLPCRDLIKVSDMESTESRKIEMVQRSSYKFIYCTLPSRLSD